MRKNNAALLSEIQQMENEVAEACRERDKAREHRDTLHAHATAQNQEILWLKRIIEGLVNAPSIVTRPK